MGIKTFFLSLPTVLFLNSNVFAATAPTCGSKTCSETAQAGGWLCECADKTYLTPDGPGDCPGSCKELQVLEDCGGKEYGSTPIKNCITTCDAAAAAAESCKPKACDAGCVPDGGPSTDDGTAGEEETCKATKTQKCKKPTPTPTPKPSPKPTPRPY